MTDLYRNGWRLPRDIPSRLRIIPQSIQPRPTTNEGWRTWNEARSVAFHFMFYQRVVDIRNEFAQLHMKDEQLDDYIKSEEAMKQNPFDKTVWYTSTIPVKIESIAERLAVLAEETDDQKKQLQLGCR